MERSSASVGSGIFRCRSGCDPGGGRVAQSSTGSHPRWSRRNAPQRHPHRSAEQEISGRVCYATRQWVDDDSGSAPLQHMASQRLGSRGCGACRTSAVAFSAPTASRLAQISLQIEVRYSLPLRKFGSSVFPAVSS
jgi:hypothetical protein